MRRHAWLVGLVLWGCRSEELAPYACTCSFLTDTDGTSELRVEICAPPARAETEASGCAQTAAPAPVQSCRCQLLAGAEACTRARCVPR